MSKMISTTVYMTERQRILLDALAVATRVPFSEFVRRGIDMAIEAENKATAEGDVLLLQETDR